MPSHSPLTDPWNIGGFIIGYNHSSKYTKANSHVFMNEGEVLATLTMLQQKYGRHGGVWESARCAPSYLYMTDKSVPEPFHCVDIWSTDPLVFQTLRTYMTRTSLDQAKLLFSKSARIESRKVPILMMEHYGAPYSWVHFLRYKISDVPDFFEIKEDAEWTVVREGNENVFFANDDNVLMMAKMLS